MSFQHLLAHPQQFTLRFTEFDDTTKDHSIVFKHVDDSSNVANIADRPGAQYKPMDGGIAAQCK